jgi:hypothetical protein
MNIKQGRNELCSCGSGKKYKNCCIDQNLPPAINEILDYGWRKIRHTEHEVIDKHLIPYLMDTLPHEVIDIALFEFFPAELPEMIDETILYDCLFIPWVLFNWIAKADFEYAQIDPYKTIAQNYVEVYGSSLSSSVRNFIEAMSKTYYSFYQVQEIVPNKSLVVKDLFLNTVHTIKEKSGTQTLKKGKIIFSRILTLDEQSIFIGMAPYMFSSHYKNSILILKDLLISMNDKCDLRPSVLREHSTDMLIECFFDILEAAYNQPAPQMLNTDGDPIIFSKSYFQVSLSPREVLEKLLPLTLSADSDDFINDAEYNSKGEIKKIEFPWLKKGNKQHKYWDNTVMGHILVEGNRLILETNSAKRNDQGKKLLCKHLGKNNIVFQNTIMEDPEQKLKSTPKSNFYEQEQSELLALPEVQEQLKQMAIAHWEHWFDSKIPALGNKTPRQASKTVEGRKRLEALLQEYEENEQAQNVFKADINYLKRELNLL